MTRSVERLVWVALSGLSLAVEPVVGQNRIGVSPGFAEILGGVYGEVYSIAAFGVTGRPDVSVRFKVTGIFSGGTPVSPNLIVASPSIGTTPATIFVGPDPNVTRKMAPGRYEAVISLTTVDQTPPATTSAFVTLTLRAPPPPNIGAVVNTASLQPVVSPGSMVTIFGTSLGPPVFSAEYDSTGLYPTRFVDTTVTFNGIVAPLLYMSPGQINAVAPYRLAGQRTAEVVVAHYGQTSPAFSVPVTDTSPAIFTASQGRGGQGAILNVPANPSDLTAYSFNSGDNPAAPGSAISLFVTGFGVWDDTVPDASISITARSFRAKPVSLSIGGQPATILYAGAAPYQTMGMLQVNALVPPNAASGPQPLVLAIGQTDNAQQQVTIAVK